MTTSRDPAADQPDVDVAALRAALRAGLEAARRPRRPCQELDGGTPSSISRDGITFDPRSADGLGDRI